jgi:GDPmannose 4,6-dehydratase
MKKRALITGIGGMDGSHLAEFLISKDYEVFGLERRKSTPYAPNLKNVSDKINLLKGDLSDQNSLLRAVKDSEPHEVYNLGAQSFAGESWGTPEQTSDITGLGALRVLEAIREYGNKNTKFYQASSSEMFGKKGGTANELTDFHPCSPYGVAKLYAHWITKNYRESHGIFAVNGILFNHESERRGVEFVTRKITDGVAKIKLGLADHITLGNLEAKRDWGYAPDYVVAMWKMLQKKKPDDYVIATGQQYSVKQFINLTAKELGMLIEWKGRGINEKGYWNKRCIIEIDKKYFRPTEVNSLKGNSEKARRILGWKPKTGIKSLIKEMVNFENSF